MALYISYLLFFLPSLLCYTFITLFLFVHVWYVKTYMEHNEIEYDKDDGKNKYHYNLRRQPALISKKPSKTIENLLHIRQVE